mgnify:CR=1 FL=1
MKEYKVKVFDNGGKEWFLNGQLHRDDGPAIEYADGAKSWYKEGKLHREDGPAVEYADGSNAYYCNGTYCGIKSPFNNSLWKEYVRQKQYAKQIDAKYNKDYNNTNGVNDHFTDVYYNGFRLLQ